MTDEACQPHLYPFATEHEWERTLGMSETGGAVEYRTVQTQQCRRCGWVVRVTTTLETLA